VSVGGRKRGSGKKHERGEDRRLPRTEWQREGTDLEDNDIGGDLAEHGDNALEVVGVVRVPPACKEDELFTPTHLSPRCL
jgi:hypothetical protein